MLTCKRTTSLIYRASQKFNNQNLDEFWCSQIDSYPVLATKALSALIPFATYLCESAFSTLVNLKPKPRNRLSARRDMHLALSRIVPRILDLIDGINAALFFGILNKKYSLNLEIILQIFRIHTCYI